MNIIYTVYGNYPDYSSHCFPSITRYASNINTKMHVITEENLQEEYNQFGNVKWNFLIFEVFRHFINSNHKRMVFFDLDILISSKTPNIFTTFCKDGIYMREGHSWKKMEKYTREIGQGNTFDNKYTNYFSPGVIIADRQSIALLLKFIKAPFYIGDFKGNQGIINYALARANINPNLIPGRWHFTRGWNLKNGIMGPRNEYYPDVKNLSDIYIIHYAGINTKKLRQIKNDKANNSLNKHLVDDKKHILITGSSGFLGQRLLKRHSNAITFDIVDGENILDIDSIEKKIIDNQIDTIIHLAAVADLNKFQKNTDIGNRINIEGSDNIIKLCRKYHLRLLFASTCCCYGNNNCHPSSEISPLCPTEPYALSKKITEEKLSNETFPYTIMRLATFYGPGMRKELAIYKMLNEIYNDKEVLIHGDGKQTRTYTHVDDIVNCIITILNTPNKFNIVNCTNTESISVLDIIHECEEVCGKKAKLNFGKDREGQIYKEEILNTRVKSLGCNFKFNFKDGIKNTFEWYLKK